MTGSGERTFGPGGRKSGDRLEIIQGYLVGRGRGWMGKNLGRRGERDGCARVGRDPANKCKCAGGNEILPPVQRNAATWCNPILLLESKRSGRRTQRDGASGPEQIKRNPPHTAKNIQCRHRTKARVEAASIAKSSAPRRHGHSGRNRQAVRCVLPVTRAELAEHEKFAI